MTLTQYKQSHRITGKTKRISGYRTHAVQGWTYKVLTGPNAGMEFTIEQKI